MDIAMMFAKKECYKYRDHANNDPVDEDDVAFMYLVGYMAGKGHDVPESKAAAVQVAHHWMRKGHEIGERLTQKKQDFRLSLE